MYFGTGPRIASYFMLEAQTGDRSVGRVLRFDSFSKILSSGIRIGFSLTLIGTILGEMFGSQRGLGYLLMTAIGLQNIQVIMSVTLLLVLVAATVNTLLLAQDRRLRNPGSQSR